MKNNSKSIFFRALMGFLFFISTTNFALAKGEPNLRLIKQTYDYTYDPQDVTNESYTPARNSQACNLFLENLRYFAARKLSRSCVTSTPPLKDNFKIVEWEDVNPDQYPTLFGEVVSRFLMIAGDISGEKPPKNKAISWYAEKIKKQMYVFRRAKLTLTGYPVFEYDDPAPENPIAFQVIQFGPSKKNKEQKNLPDQCSIRPDAQAADLHRWLVFYLATDDLQRLYRYSVQAQNIWRLDDQFYIEGYADQDDIQLMQINLGPDEEVGASPVCLYHLQKKNKESERWR